MFNSRRNAPKIELAVAAEAELTKKKIEYASTVRIEALRPEVDEILRHVAQLLKEPEESEDDWLDYVFVSDESRLADFISTDLELQELRVHLANPTLERREFICAIALALRKKRAPQTVH